MDNQKNLLLAVIFSIAVLIGYDFFFAPKKELQSNLNDIKNDTLPKKQGTESEAPSISEKLSSKSNNSNFNEKRVSFKSQRLEGSINLYGATIDEIILSDYFETINKEKKIKLLQKENSSSPYFLRMGWASTNKSLKLPNKDSLWKSLKNVNTNETIQLEWNNNQGITIKREISFDENFMIKIEDTVFNKTGEAVELTNFSYIRRKNHRPANKFFILHEGPLGVFNDTLQEFSYDDIEEQKEIVESSTNGWIGYTDHYWQVAIFPETDEPFKARFKTLKNSKNSIQIDFINDNIKTLKSGESLSVKSYVFAGAKEVPLIDDYIKNLNVNKLDLSVDFGWFYFLTKPFFYTLNWLSKYLGNFGLAIIGLTIIIKLLFFPLANGSYRSMAKMRALQPKLTELRERYKGDQQALNKAMMEMYKTEKVNPAAGCLPIFIQIPVFFALYKVLYVTIEMRHAPFYGWIDDLSVKDPTTIFNLFGLIPWDPPSFMIIGIWPILMGLTMYLQQKLNPAPPDPIQAKIFSFFPLFITILLSQFAAGLVIYWTTNNILSILQQWIITRRTKIKTN